MVGRAPAGTSTSLVWGFDILQLTGRGLKPGDMGYNESPTDNDRIHCVCFVISASAVSVMDDAVLDKFKAIREEAKRRSKTLKVILWFILFSDLYPIVILTKVDQICDDTQEVFHSIEVFEKVSLMLTRLYNNLQTGQRSQQQVWNKPEPDLPSPKLRWWVRVRTWDRHSHPASSASDTSQLRGFPQRHNSTSWGCEHECKPWQTVASRGKAWRIPWGFTQGAPKWTLKSKRSQKILICQTDQLPVFVYKLSFQFRVIHSVVL